MPQDPGNGHVSRSTRKQAEKAKRELCKQGVLTRAALFTHIAQQPRERQSHLTALADHIFPPPPRTAKVNRSQAQ